MKRMVLVISVVLLMSAATVSVFAAGGKNRGAKGQGAVTQVQVVNSEKATPPTFPAP